MEKEQEKEDVLDNLQERSPRKKTFMIIIIVILLAIILFLGISAYFYFKTPEKTLGLGANIESSLLSQDGKTTYLKLAGGSLDKNITKIKFIFTDKEGNEHVYETSEGVKEIEVPFKRSFWDWLFRKPTFSGKYDYEINSEEIGLNDFNNINEISVSFEYKTETGETIETPKLDTGKPTPTLTPTPSPGGGGTTPTPEPTPTCTDSDAGINYYEKGNTASDGITNEDNCNNDILTEYYCNATLIEEVNYNCSLEGKVCLEGRCIEIRECTSNENCSYLRDVCSYGICNASNKCEISYNDSGTVCNDDLFCTENDVCNGAGNCGGIVKDCSDAIACTEDICNEINNRCENIVNNSKCNYPAEICNKTQGCIANSCYGITSCSDYTNGINCTSDFCGVGICEWNETSGVCEEALGECFNDADCSSRGPGFICNASNICEWKPPIGIPKPTFGIEETYRMYDNSENRNSNLTYTQNAEGGFYTHYVDNTHPNATDTSNLYGTASKPRTTIPLNLPEGSVVEVHGGPYTSATWRLLTANGTSTYPVFVRGINADNMPIISFYLRVAGSYLILENLSFDGGAPILHRTYENDYVAIRYVEVTNSTGISINNARNIVVYKNDIHDNGDWQSPLDIGYHAIGIQADGETDRVWIVDNHLHHNGADGMQVADLPKHLYIGRNEMNNNRENAVDLKGCQDCIVSQNKFYGYRVGADSNGDAVRLNDEGVLDKIWVIFNDIYDSVFGINSGTTTTTPYIIGNTVHNSSWGIVVVGGSYVINNVVYNTERGIYAKNSVIINNIVSNASNYHLYGDVEMRNNLLWQNGGAVTIRGTASCIDCIEADPLFVDAANGDFHLQPTSPAIDAGIESEVYQRFYDLYGINISKDIEGRIRPQGSSWDIGAYEYSGSVGGTSASLSPFTKLLNFLKGLLTRKTGKAILTGKIITGNVVNKTNGNKKGESKVLYIFLSLLAAIILIIVIIIVKKKNKKKSNKRKLKRLSKEKELK